MNTQRFNLQSFILLLQQFTSLGLFILIVLIFGSLSDRFLTWQNFENILIQSSSLGIIAIGMTFVLLTAGIDLSIGSIMFLSAVIAGKLVLAGYPLFLAIAAILLIGPLYGMVNALFITRLRMIPFIVTLATLYLGRGLGYWISETRAMNLPENFTRIGSARLLDVLPFPILIFTIVLLLAHFILSRTAFGRQVYAIGYDVEAAKKAGIPTERILFTVYIISGLCAAVGGLVSVAQGGSVAPSFGEEREFAAISAAVLGGTSLFGGRGNAFPGTVLGAILIQTIDNGLVIINANPYVYPLVTSAIIFIAVLLDSRLSAWLVSLKRKKIRVEQDGAHLFDIQSSR
ncbi:MAG: ABC transporter permease [bacterium]|jgi:ribose transport system permease protein